MSLDVAQYPCPAKAPSGLEGAVERVETPEMCSARAEWLGSHFAKRNVAIPLAGCGARKAPAQAGRR